MNDCLILYICLNCGKEHYFEQDSIPGGKEHCEYCELCQGILSNITGIRDERD